jgi:plasmid maintenance system antidote protein VapI
MAIQCPPDFSTRLRAVLAARKIPKTGLAEFLGVSRVFVTLMCAGTRKPSKPVAKLLAQRVGPAAWAYVMAETDALPTAAE